MLATLVLALTLASASDPGTLTVTSDCNFGLFVDGVEVNSGNVQQSWRAEGLAPGRHAVKVDCWNSPFSHEVLVEGYVTIPPGAEVRVKATRGKLEVFGQAALAPRVDLRRVQELIAEVDEYLKEAEETNEDEEASCQAKVGGRLEALREALQGVRAEPSKVGARRVQAKLQDLQGLVAERCPKRVAKKLGRKVERAAGKAAELVRAAP